MAGILRPVSLIGIAGRHSFAPIGRIRDVALLPKQGFYAPSRDQEPRGSSFSSHFTTS